MGDAPFYLHIVGGGARVSNFFSTKASPFCLY